MENSKSLKRNLGLVSATCMLSGCVIGASVFIVPGELASTIGPAVWLSYLIGAGLIIFACFTFAQTGSVMQVAGASYMLCNRAVNGTWGFLYIWVFLIGSLFVLPIMALATVRYLGVFFPFLNNIYVAIIILAITGAINIAGMGLSAKIQNIMVVIFVVVISVFGIGGIVNMNPQNFVPMFPEGISPVVFGAMSTYFAFSGFNYIIELSGEIKDPGRNIPRTIFASYIVVIIIYLLMAVALVALISPSGLTGLQAPAVDASKLIFPGWFSYFIALAAIAASWTTVNAVLAAMSRDVYAMAKCGFFPNSFAKLNSSSTPYIAIIGVTILGIIATLFQAGIMKYIQFCSVYLMLVAMIIAVASLRIKTKLADEYEQAIYKLKGFWYYFWPIGILVSSTYFLYITVIADVKMSIYSAVFAVLGLVVYYFRKRQLSARGLDIDTMIKESMTSKE